MQIKRPQNLSEHVTIVKIKKTGQQQVIGLVTLVDIQNNLDYHLKTHGKMEKTTDTNGFRKLIQSVMNKRLVISSVVLITFLGLIVGIGVAISWQSKITEEWKELLLLMLGAFIGSYGKIIDYWFSDTDKDKMLVQKMDEEDGRTLSKKD